MKAKQVYEFIQKKSLKNSVKDNIGINYHYQPIEIKINNIEIILNIDEFKPIINAHLVTFIKNNRDSIFFRNIEFDNIIENIILNIKHYYSNLDDNYLYKYFTKYFDNINLKNKKEINIKLYYNPLKNIIVE